MKYIKILTSIILLGLSVSAFAQDEKTVQKLSVFEQATEEQNRTTHFAKGVAERSLTSQLSIGGVEFSDPEFNFLPRSQLSAAGDINGDGYDDFFYTVFVADETTEDLSDRLTKLVVYYGSENGLEAANTEFIRDGFTFIADVTGDGTSEALRFEDGVLYLVVDESAGELEAIVDVEVLQLQYNSVDYRSYGDFDGDGYNDVLVYNTGITSAFATNEFYLVYGAESYEDISIDTLSYTNGERWRYDKMIYSDVDNDGTSEVIMVSSGDLDTGAGVGVISIFQKNELDEFERVREDTLSEGLFNNFQAMNAGRIGVTDLNGDDNEELIIYADGQLRIFTVSEEEGEFYTSETMLEDTFDANDFSIINDFDDDGSKELLITSTESVLLVTSDAGLEFSSTDLAMDEGDVIGLLANRTKNHNSGGDVNGDGIADIVVEFSNDNNGEYGYRAYHGNAAGNFDTTSEISFSIPENQDSPIHTFNAGDLNGDGIEDFGIVYNQVVDIYYGGGSFDAPDLSIENPVNDEWFQNYPAIGDFNNDGFSDIAMNVPGLEGGGIYIYFGGNDMNTDPDHSILFSDLYPEYEGSFAFNAFSALANIGDINGDGIDDLIFAPYGAADESNILLGGSTLSNEPDITFPFHGGNFVKLGDFNEDGTNNFAMWSINSGIDAVLVFSGFDQQAGDTLRAEPVLTLANPAEEGENLTFFGISMAAGDFDGDGFPDLAVSPYLHQNSSGEGIDAIYIYKGGTDADSIPDHSYPLLLSEFANATLVERIDSGEMTGEFTNSSIGELTTVPDMNGDGTDELLFGTTPGNFGNNGLSNAAIYYGKEDLSQIAVDGQVDILLEAPNRQLGMANNNNSILASGAHSAVGDFSGNGTREFILSQGSDFNYLKSYVYLFEDPTSVSNEEELTEAIKDFKLNQNYPNPFNPTTKISYTLPVTGDVKLQVFDITGRLVSTVVNQRQVAGSHVQNFDASAFASGVYIYRLQAAGFTQTRKMLLIK